MSQKIFAPFTEDQVKKLKAWQEGNVQYIKGPTGVLYNNPSHPFTCCSGGCKRTLRDDQGILIPTTIGWTCPCGVYKQYWCYDFMVADADLDIIPTGTESN